MIIPSRHATALAVRVVLLSSLLSPLALLDVSLSAQATSEQITAADLRSRLYRIADDSMAGRATGSLGNYKTAEYVASEFKRLGLQPGGENGGWFQVVPFFVSAPVKQALGTRLGGIDYPWRYGADYVILGRPAANGQLRDIPVARGGEAGDSSTWIDAAAAAGKVVVLDARQVIATPGRILANPRFAQAAAIALVELDRLGAAPNFLQARPTVDTTRGRARPVQLVVSARMAATMTAGATVSGDASLGFVPVPYAARNVIGILPGRDAALKGQYVAITGHNDHVGICGPAVDHDSLRAHNRIIRPMGADSRDRAPTPDEAKEISRIRDSLRRAHPARADSICNGADDDGTGTAAILELAEAFASIGSSPENPMPRRSLLFVSHAAEEIGLVGSAWFTDHATVPVDSIVASIDEDMIGRGRADDLPAGGPTYLEVVGAGRVSKEFGDMLEAANRRQKVPFVFNYEFNAPGHPLRYYCRADHYNYARYGIPAVAFSRGEHLDYHQVTDEAQYIDYDDMNRVVHMVFDAVVMLANADHRPALNAPKGDPHAVCVQ
jgi:hypothetical protein